MPGLGKKTITTFLAKRQKNAEEFCHYRGVSLADFCDYRYDIQGNSSFFCFILLSTALDEEVPDPSSLLPEHRERPASHPFSVHRTLTSLPL